MTTSPSLEYYKLDFGLKNSHSLLVCKSPKTLRWGYQIIGAGSVLQDWNFETFDKARAAGLVAARATCQVIASAYTRDAAVLNSLFRGGA